MPVYQYKCDNCGDVLTDIKNLATRNEPVKCGSCGGDAPRIIETGRKISVRCDWEDYRGMRE